MSLLFLSGCGGGEETAQAPSPPVEEKEVAPPEDILAREAEELRKITAPPPMPPPAPPAPDLSPQLIGAWEHNTRVPKERAHVHGITRFYPDGRLQVTATMRAAHRLIDVEATGKWTLDGDILTTTIETSSSPELLPVGHAERDRIESVDAQRLVYTDSRGKRWIEERVQ